METRKIFASALIYLMLVTQMTAFGALLPRETEAQAKPKKAVRPVLECVEYLGGTNYVARFGYQNDNPQNVTIEVGDNNKFSPTPINRGQTTTFLPGRRTNVFQVPFDGSNLVWFLKGPDGEGRTATASSNPAQRCASTPSPTPTVTPTPTATPTVTPTPAPTPGVCAPGTFTFGGGQQQTSGAPNVRTASANGNTLSTRAFARPRAGIALTTNFTPSFVSNQRPGYGVTNPGESGGGDSQKVDNADDQGTPQVDYLVQYSSTPVVFDRAVLEKIGADSDVKIWIGNVAAAPTSINQAFLNSLYTEDLPDGGGPTRTINFNAGNLAGNLLIIAPKPDGRNDSFNLKSVTFTCPPTGPVNTPPDAVNDAATVAEDSGSTTINVLANDTDADGNALTITAVTQPAGGTVTNNGSNISFTPSLNFAGAATFNYTISDGQGGSDTATVTVTVTQVNDAPVAVNNSYSTNEDTALNVPAPGVLGNDMDVENNPLTAQIVATTSNGALALLANGSFSYTPNANFSGTDSFTYVANDGLASSTPATVTITVNAVNDGPDAVNDSATVEEDSSNNLINVLANDSDPDGGMLTITGATNGTNGTVINNGTNLSYTPNANFNGSDSFTYTIADGQGGSDTATVSITVTAAADAPVANNDNFATDEDTPLNVPAPGVLSNDTDADGGSLTTSLVVGPTNGQLTFLGDGSFLYTPNPNFTGSDSFTYVANDGTTDSNVAVVSLAINAVNDGPDAVDDSATTDEDTAAAINVLANDTDADGNTLAIQSATNGANGSVINNGTNLTYTPNANFNGTDTFTYTVADGNGGSDTATVTVTVNAVNDAPVAVNDSYSTGEGTPLNVAAPGVLGNDTDVDSGTTLTAALVTGATNGSLTLNADGSFSYTPNAGFSGSDSFTYRANDGSADSNVATVTINVNNQNDAPDAVNDAATVAEDSGANAINVLANDTDADGDTLSITAVTQGANGSVTFTATGVSYTPNANFNGSDSFTYTISDGNGGTDAATVSITVTAVNDAPDAVDDAGFTTTEDNVLSIPSATLLANDNDGGDGGPLTLTAVSPASANGGTVTIVGSSVRYTPALDFAGTDTFTYTISDGSATDTATVTVTVTDVPVVSVALLLNEVEIDPPNATSPACQYAEFRGEPGYVVPTGTSFVSINGTPGNFGDVFFIANLSGATVGSNGTITVINDLEPCPNRTFPSGTTVVSVTNFSGFGENAARTFAVVNSTTPLFEFADIDTNNNGVIDPNLNISVVDGVALTTNVELEATFGLPLIYDAASSGNGLEHPDAATRFLGDTTPLSAAAWYYGEMADTPDESTVYEGTPRSANFPTGGRLTPGEQNTLFVASVPPVANDDSATVAEDSGANAIDVLANDTDSDGGTLSVTAATQGANGSVTFTATGVSYSPNANFAGSDSFTYTVSDGQGDFDTATVSVTVTAVNDAPIAQNDGYSTSEDTPLNVAAPGVLANDADIDNASLTAVLVSNVSNGTLTLNANGSFSYTPNPNFSGSDSFTYQANDGAANSNTATVTIAVGGVNDAPDAVNDSATVAEDSTATVINVLANDTDGDGDALTITAVTQPANGSVVNNGSNVSFTPAANFNGGTSFTYTISDGNGGSDTATVNITVTPVNDSPDAVNDAATVNEDSNANAINVLANDTDVDGNTLSVTAVTQGANGSVTFAATDVSYTPNANFNGSDSFTYTISDGNGGTDSATVNVTVTAVNDAPDAVNDAVSVAENSGATPINVLANDTDIDAGQTLSVTAVTQPANGEVTFTAAGVSYTPNTNFSGTDTFTYTISDGNGGTDTATVTVTVTNVNQNPDAVNDSATVNEDSGANPINVLANDTDVDGDTLSVTAVTQGANGSVTFTATGVSYTPNSNFAGSDGFTYTISDGNGASDTATVSVTVTQVNDAPDAVNDAATVAEDSGANVINVLANDTDPEGNTLTVSAVTQGANGTVVNNGSNVSYSPNANFFGTDTFTYTISDGNGGSDTATVTVTVIDVADIALLVNEVEGDAPDASFQFACQYVELRGAPGYVVPAGAYFVSINGASASFGDLQFVVPLAGVTVGSNGTITIINDLEGPCPNRTFPAGTTLVTVSDFDGLGLIDGGARTFAIVSSTQTLFTAFDIDTNEDRVIDPSSGVSVVDGFAITTNNTFQAGFAPVIFEAIADGAPGTIFLPDAATRFIDNTTSLSAAAWYYGELASSPAETTVYSGTPQSANFPAGGRLTPGAPNTLTPVNAVPNAVDDSATVAEDSGASVVNVLANDTDGNGDTLTITAITQPANGSVVNTSTNVSFTPNANFSGSTSFTYTISDGNGGSDTATVSVTVTPVNDPPIAVNDAATVNEDTTGNLIEVLANDNDGGDGGALTVVSVTQPANGSVTNNSNNVSYTPNANFFGTDTFTYTVGDGTNTALGTVTVTVTDVPDGPVVNLLVNEVEGDAPDAATQFACQYVELRGSPGYVVPAGTYFASINGASASFGDLQFVVDLSGQIVGPNGTITIINILEGTCPGRTFPADTTLIQVEDFDGLGLIDGGARTFAILSSTQTLFSAFDIDVNEDRVVDPSSGVTVIDGFAITTNNTFQAGFAPVIFEAISQGAPGTIFLPDAATRFLSDTTPLSGAAWYFGELASTPANTTTYSGTPQSVPFPSGGALTPGAPNVP